MLITAAAVASNPSPIQRISSTGVVPRFRLPAPSVVVETTSGSELMSPQIVTPMMRRTAATLATVANAAAAVGPAPRSRNFRAIGRRTQARIAARITGRLRIGRTIARETRASRARTTSVRQLIWASRSSQTGTSSCRAGSRGPGLEQVLNDAGANA